MGKVLERMLLVGLGAWSMTRDKVSEAVHELAQEEDVEPEEARRLVDALVAKGEKEREELREMIRHEVERARPVTRKEFEELSSKVDRLGEQVERLADAIAEEEN